MLFGQHFVLECEWEAPGRGWLRHGPFNHPRIQEASQVALAFSHRHSVPPPLRQGARAAAGATGAGGGRGADRSRSGRAASAVGGAAGPGGGAAVTRWARQRRPLPRFRRSGLGDRRVPAASSDLCAAPPTPRAAAVGTPGGGGHRGQVSVGEGASVGVAHLQHRSTSRPISHHVRRDVGHHFL